MWGQWNYSRVTKDGDINAPGYEADNFYIALGTDFDLAEDFVLGVGAAYVQHDLNLDRQNGVINSDGFQVGAYAVYAPGPYYLKGVVSYTELDGEGRRSIDIGTIGGTLRGLPSANIWSLSGEVGYNVEFGSSVITPYAGVEHIAAKLDSFTETGVDGAALTVFDNEHNRTASTLGARWLGQFGSVVPEIDLGWRHQFGGRVATVDQAFAGVANSGFSVVSPLEDRDLAVVGVALNAKLSSRANLRVAYDGRFNGDFEAHTGSVVLVLPFGGK
ncbi:autotransporter outer membrane beta-barrel domain-containing protein [Kamptonema cortianum]|nr:autotransporter outer membrane beta-barrel domain-containing protein [Kamptonema cortianum]